MNSAPLWGEKKWCTEYTTDVLYLNHHLGVFLSVFNLLSCFQTFALLSVGDRRCFPAVIMKLQSAISLCACLYLTLAAEGRQVWRSELCSCSFILQCRHYFTFPDVSSVLALVLYLCIFQNTYRSPAIPEEAHFAETFDSGPLDRYSSPKSCMKCV